MPRSLAFARTFCPMTLLYLAWQLQPANLDVFAYGYDEGVYLQTAWAVQRGHALYAETFSAQPPLLPTLLAGLFQLTGPSVEAARALVAGLSAAALVGVALLAGRGGGWVAGVGAMALLALSPGFLLGARTVSPEVPALALATLAVGLAVHAERRWGWWLAIGGVAALAALTKLSALVVVPALALPLLVGWVRAPRGWAALRPVVATLALPLLLGALVLAWVDLGAAADQVLGLRADAYDAYPEPPLENARRIVAVARAHPAAGLLALVGVVALWQRGRWLTLLTSLTLLLTTLAALLTYRPLFGHHLVLLWPPVAALGGVGLAALAGASVRLARARRPAALAPILALGAAAALLPSVAATSLQSLPAGEDRAVSAPAEAVAALAALPPASVVLTDGQLVAFAAGQPAPPALVDTSAVRIGAGYLDPEGIRDFVRTERPDAILLWSNRLWHIPGFRSWVRQRYRLAGTFGGNRELYLAP
jgi:4-amino-4-deoxy-L-arabinose transferase-like glycosyltransferase